MPEPNVRSEGATGLSPPPGISEKVARYQCGSEAHTLIASFCPQHNSRAAFFTFPPSRGLATLGIEADGAIKGCPSLPTSAYTGGNIRDHSLRTIIEEAEELRFNLGADTPKGTDHLWGFCKTCEFAQLCRGGCSWTAHVFFDKRGNNPYCHHRALTQAKCGVRERVKLKHKAEGNPFDNGEFTLFSEPINAPWPENDPLRFTSDRIQWSESWFPEPELVPSVVG